MSDFIWFVVIGAVFALTGCIFIRLGLLIWKKQRMDLIISYHCDKVSDGNKRAYCRLFGIGLMIIGIGFIISGICMAFTTHLISWIPMAAGLTAGILLLAVSMIKYNR